MELLIIAPCLYPIFVSNTTLQGSFRAGQACQIFFFAVGAPYRPILEWPFALIIVQTAAQTL